MKKVNLCECCGLNKAEVKDYRGDEVTGDINEYYVCENCFHLNNYWFNRLRRVKNKKRIIKLILGGGDWKEWLIT